MSFVFPNSQFRSPHFHLGEEQGELEAMKRKPNIFELDASEESRKEQSLPKRGCVGRKGKEKARSRETEEASLRAVRLSPPHCRKLQTLQASYVRSME